MFNGTAASEILKKTVVKRKRKKPEVKPEESVGAEAQSVPI